MIFPGQLGQSTEGISAESLCYCVWCLAAPEVLVRNKGMDTFLTHFGHQLLRNVQNMSKICPKHVQLLNVSKYCPKCVHNCVKCPKSIQTYGHVLDNFMTSVQRKLICPKCVQNMSNTKNMSKRCPYSYQMSKKCPNLWTCFGHLHERCPK